MASFGCGDGASADARCAVRGASHSQRAFVWLPWEGAGAARQAEAPPRSDLIKFELAIAIGVLIYWVERQGEDLPFDDEGERTPLSNHPPLSPIAVAIHHASMRLFAPSRCHSGLKRGQACVTPL